MRPVRRVAELGSLAVEANTPLDESLEDKMKHWKTRLFGDNSFNFYGWIVAGLVVLGWSAYFVKRGLDADQYLSAQAAYLIAIYMLLLGCFGVVLHTYLARVAEKLDAPKKEKADEHDG